MNQNIVLNSILTFLQILTFPHVFGYRISKTECDDNQSMFPLTSKIFSGSGQDAAPKEFPFMVRVYNGNGSYSNGILISDNFVLTIARNSAAKYVILGESDHPKHAVMKRIQHPAAFNVHPSHVLELLKLKKSIRLYENVRPACLSQQKANISQRLIGVSWSAITDGDNKLLHKVKLQLISNTKCVEAMTSARTTEVFGDNRDIDDETHFCVAMKKGYPDVCHRFDGAALFGDDGMNSNEIVGIASMNTGCGNVYPHTIIRVSKYIPWIERELMESVQANFEIEAPNLLLSLHSSLQTTTEPGMRTDNKTPTTIKTPRKVSRRDQINDIILIVMLSIVFALLCICCILVICIRKYKMENRWIAGVSYTRRNDATEPQTDAK